MTEGDRDRAADRIAAMRRSYPDDDLREADLAGDWLTQFRGWFAAAVDSGLLAEPNAMVLATAGAEGRPSARTVLLKGYDRGGFVFYTNYDSRKARELAENPAASVVFSWPALHRQIVVTGTVDRVDRATSEAYFGSRPRGSQLGAWASPQSAVVPSRAALDEVYAQAVARFPDGVPVPPPEHWGGLRLAPDMVEFWQGRVDRLHDRLRYRRVAGGEWIIERLGP